MLYRMTDGRIRMQQINGDNSGATNNFWLSVL